MKSPGKERVPGADVAEKEAGGTTTEDLGVDTVEEGIKLTFNGLFAVLSEAG